VPPALHEVLVRLLRVQPVHRCTAQALLDTLNRRQCDAAMANVRAAEEVPLVPYLVNVLDSCCQEFQHAALSMLVDTERCDGIASAGAILPLVKLLSSGADSTKGLAAEAVWNLVDGDAENGRAFIAARVAPLLVQLITNGPADTQEFAAGALASLSLDECNQTTIVASGAIAALVQLLREGDKSAWESAALALRCLVRYSGDHSRSIIAAGAFHC
jgi:hypothetical protein